MKKVQEQFDKINHMNWKLETDMYAGTIKAIQAALYPPESGIFVVDTHSIGYFCHDVSVADYNDSRLIFFWRYFIKFKPPTSRSNLLTPENCGHVLDYFVHAKEVQPHRREFIGVLSDFDDTFVFTAEITDQEIRITTPLQEQFSMRMGSLNFI